MRQKIDLILCLSLIYVIPTLFYQLYFYTFLSFENSLWCELCETLYDKKYIQGKFKAQCCFMESGNPGNEQQGRSNLYAYQWPVYKLYSKDCENVDAIFNESKAIQIIKQGI